jgi:hypothetical protein
MPGVEAVGLATSAPFGDNVTLEAFRGPGDTGTELPKAYIAHANADYLRALGARLLKGRAFTVAEAEQRAPVVVIDADLAARAFGDADPIGRTLGVTGGADGALTDATVVGVVGRLRQRTLAERDEYPSLFLPAAVPYAVPGIPVNELELVVRTRGAGVTVETLQARLRAEAPGLRLTDALPMPRRIAGTIADALRLATLLQVLSAATVLLTAVGLYALLAHAVAMRQREFGIRQALGATARDLMAAVLGQGARMLALAFAFGVPLALVLGALLAPRLHRLSPSDPVSLLVVGALLVAVGAAANAVPAWRAARVRPMDALRNE